MTYVPEWPAELEYWKNLAGKKAGGLRIVYGGSESFTRKGFDVVSWNAVGESLTL